MKKSAKVTINLLSSIAIAVMNGCGGDSDDGDWVEAKRCVDNNNVVVEERLCESPSTHGRGTTYHRYYYGGRGYYPGDVISGGSHLPQSGVTYRNPSQMPRGGFGSTGRAFVSRGGSVSS